MLLLPAAYAAPEDFVREGFVRAARDRLLPLDLVFVELKLQHLTDRTVLRRLRHEIILPARAAGCLSIWLGGISLGGFVALAYAERYPREIDGLCLFAPYLGNRMVTNEIERANGVHGWTPGALADDDDERRIWRYIKGQRDRSVPLHLGFGQEDRFADSHRLMAAALEPSSVDTVPGGHEWPAWRRLWENFLDTRFSSGSA
ncbi:MAG TPA: alpha/beta hydrolase [Steroidobacteraceae bacterium]|nr:alpha/beta hydrolase [Steroidobacteraceae bacterium]